MLPAARPGLSCSWGCSHPVPPRLAPAAGSGPRRAYCLAGGLRRLGALLLLQHFLALAHGGGVDEPAAAALLSAQQSQVQEPLRMLVRDPQADADLRQRNHLIAVHMVLPSGV